MTAPLKPREGVSSWVVALALGLLVACAIAGFYSLERIRSAGVASLLAARQYRAIELHSASLVEASATAQAAIGEYELSRRAENLRLYDAERVEAQAQFAGLENLAVANEHLHQPLSALKAAYLNWVVRADEIRDGARRAVRSAPSGAGGAAAIEMLEAKADSLADAADTLGAAQEVRTESARKQVTDLITFLGILFLATTGFTVLWVYGERRTLQNITRRLRAANADIELARARAEDADAAKSRFLALASHDMRQPLHALTLYLAALRRRVESDQAKDIVSRMDMAAQSLTRMFSGLLDLARIESGVLQARPVAFPLQRAFDSVVQEIKMEAASARAELRVAPTSAEVYSDPELLESILRNLLTNALKYAPGGRVLLGCRRAGGAVRIEVRDEGPGIASDKLTLVFGEFVRLDTAKGVEGLGLGLSIAARLARLLGAHLEAQSAPGRGALFKFSLPLAGGTQRGAGQGTWVSGADLAGLRIAVQDDEPLALEAMVRVLEDAGANVRAYADARGYIEAVAAGAQFDLVIADPVLLHESRRAGAFDAASAPVIVLTGSTDAPTLARFAGRRMEVLIKPVSEAQLLATAARVARTLAASVT